MQIKTVQPIDMGQDFQFTLGNLHVEGRHYQAGDVIDLEPVVSFTLDSNDLEYHFENFYSPVDTIDVFDIILAPAYPGVSPVWDRQNPSRPFQGANMPFPILTPSFLIMRPMPFLARK